MCEWRDLPLISERDGGLEVRGERGPFADDVYASGLIPVWGLNLRTVTPGSLVGVRFGDRFRVQRDGRKWVVVGSDDAPVGVLKWRAGDSGKPHPRVDAMIVYPEEGVLEVQRAVLDRRGRVVDIAGTVTPSTVA